MIDYLIVYELKAREIENVCLLKAELERRNYTVDIIQRDANPLKYMFWRKPRVVVVFALYQNSNLRWNVYRFVGKMRKIVNLQCEQVLTQNDIDNGRAVPKDYAAKAVHICWGEERKKQLQQRGVAHAFVTGALQMDFLREPLKQYYASRKECFRKYHIPEDKQVILYISSFAYTGFKTDSRAYKGLEEHFGSEIMKTRYQIQKMAKTQTLQWFEKLLQENNEIFIIYRPHPAEMEDKNLKKLECKYNNFQVIFQESVKQWILVVDKIYTMYSTSIVEAFFANKLCLILRPIEVPEEVDCCIYQHANYITSYDEFKASLNINRIDDFPIRPERLYDYYQGGVAYICICDLLETVLKSNIYDMPANIPFNSYFYIAIDLFKNLIREILMRFPLLLKAAKFMPYAYKKKFEEFDVEISEYRRKGDICSPQEIQSITDKIRKLL